MFVVAQAASFTDIFSHKYFTDLIRSEKEEKEEKVIRIQVSKFSSKAIFS